MVFIRGSCQLILLWQSKVLNKSKAGGQEFINDVACISRTSHVNIVTLMGYNLL